MSVVIPSRLPKGVTGPVVSLLARAGITANQLTLLQMLGGLVAAVLIATTSLFWGAVAMLIFALLDAFDGSLARYTNTASPFGSVLDASVDRIFDSAIFVGILYYYADSEMKLATLITGIALGGALTVPYVKARAETIKVLMKDGLAPRQVRTTVVIVALILASVVSIKAMTIVMAILAIFSCYTVFERLIITYKRAPKEMD